MKEDFAALVSGVGALVEPARRALYLYVVAQSEPVSREQAAAGCGLPTHTAKFHLDKLVDEGLLVAEFRRLSGRRGPGAGRPTKLYRRSDRQVEVSLPERHYDLAGQVLAAAIDDATRHGAPIQEAVAHAASATGHRLGATTTRRNPASAQTTEDTPDPVVGVLADHGYEPRVHGATVTLANCPFHALARDHTALVCAMNLNLITGLIDELDRPDLEASLDPAPDRCCVTLSTTRAS